MVLLAAKRERSVAKMMKCRSVGLDCDFVARGETEDQVMQKVAEHAKKDHGMSSIPADVVAKVKAAIHNE
jgi:predicted small metal-binding protein